MPNPLLPPPQTIPELLAGVVERRGSEPALAAIVEGQLQWLNWAELADRVAAWRAALVQRGVTPGDRVAQISTNCREWILTDLAILTAGAVHVPLHASLAAEQIAEHVADCGARLAIVRDAGLADRLRKTAAEGVSVATHDELSEAAGASAVVAHGGHGGRSGPVGGDLATLLYTSGTTGTPLGVMLSHASLTANAIAITQAAAPSGDEIRFCLLPLSHIYARTCDLYSWLVYGGRLVLAESRETVFRDLAIAAPTAINAVPYFYQKVVDRLRDQAVDNDPRHVEVSRDVRPAHLRPDPSADLGVTASGGGEQLRATLGGAIRRLYCGGAPLSPEVDRFFAERGLPILCGYGLTEAAPVISATTPGGYRSGTVGPPLADVEVRLADDGEVLARGPNLMLGYWQKEAATVAALRDGWLQTGDLGELDEAGHLRIVGRKKEMIVLATGKKAAPAQLEALLAGSPWIEQACLVGDGRKCLAALVVPNGEMLRREIRRRRLWVWSRRRAVTHPQVRALYREEIDRCLHGRAEFEQVAAFTLLDRAFSQPLGEVTPKLSLCRAVIERAFAGAIERMYAGVRRGSG